MGDFLSNFDPRRSVRELRFWAAWLAGFTFFAFTFYFCSGMHLPVWNKPALLREQLAGYRMAMPASATATDASRLAWFRPRYYFRVEVPEAEAKTWIDGLMVAARDGGEEVSEPSTPPTLPAPTPPEWFAKPFAAPRQRRDRLVQFVTSSGGSVVWLLHRPDQREVLVAVLRR